MKFRALVPTDFRQVAVPAFRPTANHWLRSLGKSRRPTYVYANGVKPATFDKVGTWRETGEPALFYIQTINDGYTSFTERYVWVSRDGQMVEVRQLGVRGRRRFMGWM